ncbi:YadA-like family protein [Acidaminococcus sp. HCP3S3_G9_1]|uniref:YadA-like family protein n=1 Tax=Acidaminococcus sp. HCP3S3_G9_1 TaxID=3438732 RepID=UPI003F91C09A
MKLSGTAKRKGQKEVRGAVLTLLVLAALGNCAYGADSAAGSGNGVAVGTGSSAPKAENVALGKGAGISYSNGASNATGDIAVGNGANINNYASQGGSIAIGKNARIENMAGGGEASFAFGQTTYSGSWWSSARIPADPTKVVGSIAMGDNTFARTGSIMIGSHNYKGELGDTTVDSASTRTSALNVYATTIGANSFSNGAFTTSTGVYNIISSEYNGGRTANPVKNLGATINGALNSVESMGGNYYAGIANTISGVANRAVNSNGALIYGAGNEITNSVTSLDGVPTDSGDSAKAFADKLRTAIAASDSGGATLAIGGGNKADYTQKTAIIGVGNQVTGTSGAVSTNNMISGYKNTASNVQHVSVIGSGNTVEDTDTALLLGDNRTLSSAINSIVIGSADNVTATDQQNVVVLGHNANATVKGGVALGSGSLASVEAGEAGYDPSTKQASTDTSSTWVATGAAVAVGSGTELTRQITSVAAGTRDTDAVNVAQLKKISTDVEKNTGDIRNLTGDVQNMGSRITKLDARVDRAWANAAALAALHPLDFDPDDKLDFAVGAGSYSGANAVALGAFYRPNEDVMLSLGGSTGGGENMVNVGATFKLGQHNHVSNSRVAMAKEIKDLRKEVENLRGALVDVSAGRKLDPTLTKLFPDVEKNHWAYEEIAQLYGNGMVEGYPDGEFKGDRMMSRYEFAMVVYREMQKGARLSERLLNEFEPELERIRVDTIAKDKNGNPTIQRVRVIKGRG